MRYILDKIYKSVYFSYIDIHWSLKINNFIIKNMNFNWNSFNIESTSSYITWFLRSFILKSKYDSSSIGLDSNLTLWTYNIKKRWLYSTLILCVENDFWNKFKLIFKTTNDNKILNIIKFIEKIKKNHNTKNNWIINFN